LQKAGKNRYFDFEFFVFVCLKGTQEGCAVSDVQFRIYFFIFLKNIQ